MDTRSFVRALAITGVMVAFAGCSGTATTEPTSASGEAAPSGSPAPAPTMEPTAVPSPTQPTPAPSSPLANDWPFVRTSCPGASGQPWLVVALGTSETAGWGIRSDEPYSPQEAYPAQYVDILCEELGVPIELHSYFPSQLGNELAPLAWWNERVAADAAMRADLAAAKVVVLWAMASHDIIPALALGACSGDWPDPLKACFEAATGREPAEMDALFSAISELVPDGAKVLAADAYLPPAVFASWGTKPYWQELRKLIDPRALVMPLALKHGFTFVDTEAAMNGPSLEMPLEGLFQSDGLHPTATGALATAQVLAKADGLGD